MGIPTAILWWNCAPTPQPKGRGWKPSTYGCARQCPTRRNEVVDCDLSNYFGEIPHAELIRSVARRVSDGRMLRLIKAWLEMPVEEDDAKGGKRRTNAARRERKGTPQGSPISDVRTSLSFRELLVG